MLTLEQTTILTEVSGSLPNLLVTASFVSTLVQPLLQYLRRGVKRLLPNRRDTPYAVLTRLGQRLETTLAPDIILPTIVSTVKEALNLPYAAVALPQNEAFRIAAFAGSPVSDTVHLPLSYQGKMVGWLLLGPRAPGVAFSQADWRLLNDLARQTGIAIHALSLTIDLQRLSIDLQRLRERLVIAREEERRRLRRDLHDDLAPTLAALALTATTIGDVIPNDPAAAVAMTTELYTAIRAAVGDIRRLVYDLRPPTLDELGLIAAIRERVAQYNNQKSIADTAALRVTVNAPDNLPALSAAVEVAAYRIVQEALTNVVRHAQASLCTIHIGLTDTLEIEVMDNGIGISGEHRIGVGLHSMRERAEELGGTCTIESTEQSGTHICARLPILKEAVD